LYGEIKVGGTGSAIHLALHQDKQVPIMLFVEWIIIEKTGQRIFDWLSQFLQNLKMIEHYQTFFNF
jgi:hypothetical protein